MVIRSFFILLCVVMSGSAFAGKGKGKVKDRVINFEMRSKSRGVKFSMSPRGKKKSDSTESLETSEEMKNVQEAVGELLTEKGLKPKKPRRNSAPESSGPPSFDAVDDQSDVKSIDLSPVSFTSDKEHELVVEEDETLSPLRTRRRRSCERSRSRSPDHFFSDDIRHSPSPYRGQNGSRFVRVNTPRPTPPNTPMTEPDCPEGYCGTYPKPIKSTPGWGQIIKYTAAGSFSTLAIVGVAAIVLKKWMSDSAVEDIDDDDLQEKESD